MVRTDSISVYLQDMAELKRTFPGYPLEKTPRRDCPSIEEYILKEGQAFQSAALTPKERDAVRVVLEDLKRVRHEEVEPGFLDTVSRLLDIESAFRTAQHAWRASNGVLGYAEGFAKHGEE